MFNLLKLPKLKSCRSKFSKVVGILSICSLGYSCNPQEVNGVPKTGIVKEAKKILEPKKESSDTYPPITLSHKMAESLILNKITRSTLDKVMSCLQNIREGSLVSKVGKSDDNDIPWMRRVDMDVFQDENIDKGFNITTYSRDENYSKVDCKNNVDKLSKKNNKTINDLRGILEKCRVDEEGNKKKQESGKMKFSKGYFDRCNQMEDGLRGLRTYTVNQGNVESYKEITCVEKVERGRLVLVISSYPQGLLEKSYEVIVDGTSDIGSGQGKLFDGVVDIGLGEQGGTCMNGLHQDCSIRYYQEKYEKALDIILNICQTNDSSKENFRKTAELKRVEDQKKKDEREIKEAQEKYEKENGKQIGNKDEENKKELNENEKASHKNGNPKHEILTEEENQ